MTDEDPWAELRDTSAAAADQRGALADTDVASTVDPKRLYWTAARLEARRWVSLQLPRAAEVPDSDYYIHFNLRGPAIRKRTRQERRDEGLGAPLLISGRRVSGWAAFAAIFAVALILSVIGRLL